MSKVTFILYGKVVLSIYSKNEEENFFSRDTADFRFIYSVMQSDGNSWKIDTFREAVNDLILILKSPTHPQLCLAKVIICS